jgi:hypothetical protein
MPLPRLGHYIYRSRLVLMPLLGISVLPYGFLLPKYIHHSRPRVGDDALRKMSARTDLATYLRDPGVPPQLSDLATGTRQPSV